MADKKAEIQRAKNFAKRAIEGKTGGNHEDYMLLLISRFLLLKERIIRKDVVSDILFFDFEKDRGYLHQIKCIVDAFEKKNPIIPGNNLRVLFIPEAYNDPIYDTEKMYILKFHKIRDALAHGKYDLDFENKVIRINNTVRDFHGNISYSAVGVLSIKDLELFSVFYSKVNSVTNTVDKINEERKAYNVETLSSNDILNIEKYYGEYSKYISKKDEKKELLKNKINNLSLIDLKLKKNDNNRQLYSKEILQDVSGAMEYIKGILTIVPESEECSEKEKSKIFEVVQKYMLAFEKICYSDEISNKDRLDIEQVESELSKLLSSKGKNKDKTPAVYNYLQTLLSNESNSLLEATDRENRMALGSLRMSKINYTFSNNSEYDRRVESIIGKVQQIINLMNDYIANYNKTNNVGQLNAINSVFFNSFYEEMLLNLASKNKTILRSIRNGIDHGRVCEVFSKMIITDASSLSLNSSNSKFLCYSEPEAFLELAEGLQVISENIQDRNPLDKISFDDMIEEIGYVLKNAGRDALYIELVGIYKKITQLNSERARQENAVNQEENGQPVPK